MSWEFNAFDDMNDLHISEQEARNIKYKQLMHLEHILKTSSYNDDQCEHILQSAESGDMFERQALIEKVYRNQLDPIRDMDSYSSTLAAKRAANR
tara:strand:- start:24148 stop:24432 length:285 start_codon:yes stop_codon:yes gene_type:complete